MTLTIARIKEEVTIDEVLAELGAELPYGGGGYGWVSMRCPFHDDTQASASINSEAGLFKCHACEAPRANGRSGDIIDVVMWELGTHSVPDAINWIRERFLDGTGL
jgi:DNA primase